MLGIPERHRRNPQDGEKHGGRLLKEVRALGYSGSTSNFYRLMALRRPQPEAATVAVVQPTLAVEMPTPEAVQKPVDPQTGHAISPIVAAALCMRPRPLLTTIQAQQVDILKIWSTDFGRMRGFVMRFRGIMRARDVDGLNDWVKEASHCGIHAMQQYARTLKTDLQAVRNAVSEPWSNGQAEGQINRLKTIKRGMFGRAGVELLRARMLPLLDPAQHTC